jgi:hypothetical protein
MLSHTHKNIVLVTKNIEQLLWYRNYIMNEAKERFTNVNSSLWKLITKQEIICISGTRLLFTTLQRNFMYEFTGMTIHVLLFTDNIFGGDRAKAIHEIRYRMPPDGIIATFTDLVPADLEGVEY